MPSEQWNITASEDRLSRGAQLYQQHCALCHRPDGQGVEDLYPPLAGTNWVTGSKDRLINVLLRGLSEPIEVNGKTYEEAMAPYAHLSDEELAAILSFIRQSWGNEAGAVLPAEVREERRLLGRVY
jgi:mono/diheme cytochrome c family protein